MLLNVLLPILLGGLLYTRSPNAAVPSFVKNHLADALWAYAFISCLLIIWERKLKTFWMMVPFCTAACFELLQYDHQIPGTGDFYDVSVYFLLFTAALLLNVFFKKLYKS